MFPNAEYYSDRTLSLPLFARMSDADVDDAVAGVKKVIAHFRK
jgi:dTDP-4-amino-4,6-dideoxygalactose transaminase